MALTAKTFAELFTYTRGTGATRVNAVGLIVGVDFSSTSNTIGTGSRTFTLTADANVNRDWPTGSAVRAVDQVGGGTMIGTVTSYTPSTQVLVINVASITGSGTSTNWRIGTLEFRLDFDPVTLAAKGGLVEGGATNLLRQSESFSLDWTTNGGGSISPNATTSPSGLITAAKLVEAAANSAHDIRNQAFSAGAGQYSYSVYAKKAERNFIVLTTVSVNSGVLQSVVDLTTGSFVNNDSPNGNARVGTLLVDAIGNGFFRITMNFSVTNGLANIRISPNTLSTGGTYVGDGASGIFIWGAQLESMPSASSYIPTTTVSVTRAADVMNIDSTRFSQFYNSAQGTLVLEMTPIAAAVIAVAASLNDGTVNNAIRAQRSAAGLAETPITTGGVLQANPILAALAANAINKLAMRIAPNNVGVSVNGAAVVADTSVTLPTVDRLSIGMNGVSGQQFNGWIRKITYSPSPMSDSELVSAST